MSLKSTAQSFSSSPYDILDSRDEANLHINTDPVEGFFTEESEEPEGSEEEEFVVQESDEPIEVVQSDEPLEIVVELDKNDLDTIELDKIPGAGDSPDPVEEVIEVVDEKDAEDALEVSDLDQNDAKKSKKSERWDWESKGPEGFVVWIKERFETVPKHSGYDTAGLERAVSYLEKLDSEISKAMRLDIEEKLDANKVEEVRVKIEDGIDRLHERLDKIKKTKKNKKKKSSSLEHESFIKEAQKITGVQGVYIMAPLFASRIARICINGMVSAGHDIEDIYAKQVIKWKLTDREQAEVMQLLADMGYPLRQDRGYMPDEDFDISVDNQFDWAAQFKG